MKIKGYILLGLIMIGTLTGCGSGFEWFPGTPQALTIITTTLPNAAIGTPYSQTLLATGGKTPYAWTLDSGTLPAGLSLNFYGVISGTPTIASTTQEFTVKLTDSASPNGTAKLLLKITIPGTTNLSIITTSPLKNGAVQQQYSTTFTASGGTPTYKNWSTTSTAVNCPPIGLKLEKSTGKFSGIPTTATNSCTFYVSVTDSANPAATTPPQPFKITINGTGSALAITTTSPLKNGAVQKLYSSIKFGATGGTSTYNNWSTSKADNCPPPGLTLAKTTGLFSGTPTQATNCTFTVTVFDTTVPTPLSGSAPFTITVQ
jgi:hypothetical protein